MNLLSKWLKKSLPRDVPIRIGQVVFHIPFNGSDHLMFKCRRCGLCCRGQRWESLLLTEGDVKRLSKALHSSSMSEFLDEECVFTEIAEPKEVWPFLGGPSARVRDAGFYLKRFEGENEETVQQPHPCRFVAEDNRCSIYEARPIVCRKFPYTTYNEDGLVHAYYVNVPFSACPGYRERRHVKRKWLSPWVKDLTRGDEEILESLKSHFFMITEIAEVPKG